MEHNDLLERARCGDIEAFEQLILENQNYIYNVIFRIILKKEDAMDLTQETLIKAYINLRKFRGNSSFKTWLYRIAVNTAMDYIRKKNGIEDELIEMQDFKTPEDIIDKKATREIIMRELNTLQAEYKIILVLRDIEGLSYNEIAEVTNLTLGTVKSRLSRARNILKERLKSIPEFLSYIEERRQV